MIKSIPSLILVGTVHRDPKGHLKLLHLLEREEPSFITVEVSPYARAFRARQASGWRDTLRENLKRIRKEEGRPPREILFQSGILGIFFLLKEPYEWRASKAYADRHGVALSDIDLSCYSRDKLSHLAELISMDNLRHLINLPSPDLSQQVESQYRRAHFLLSHPPSIWLTVQDTEVREAYMAEKIRSFVRRGKGKKILHIGGWEHLLELPRRKSLFGLLKDLQPKRILLSSRVN